MAAGGTKGCWERRTRVLLGLCPSPRQTLAWQPVGSSPAKEQVENTFAALLPAKLAAAAVCCGANGACLHLQAGSYDGQEHKCFGELR